MSSRTLTSCWLKTSAANFPCGSNHVLWYGRAGLRSRPRDKRPTDTFCIAQKHVSGPGPAIGETSRLAYLAPQFAIYLATAGGILCDHGERRPRLGLDIEIFGPPPPRWNPPPYPL